MSESIVEFLSAGFDKSLSRQTEQVQYQLNLFEEKLMDYAAQIQANTEALTKLTTTWQEESVQVKEGFGKLVETITSQQQLIEQYQAKVEELKTQNGVKDQQLEQLSMALDTSTSQVNLAVDSIKNIFTE